MLIVVLLLMPRQLLLLLPIVLMIALIVVETALLTVVWSASMELLPLGFGALCACDRSNPYKLTFHTPIAYEMMRNKDMENKSIKIPNTELSQL